MIERRVNVSPQEWQTNISAALRRVGERVRAGGRCTKASREFYHRALLGAGR